MLTEAQAEQEDDVGTDDGTLDQRMVDNETYGDEQKQFDTSPEIRLQQDHSTTNIVFVSKKPGKTG